MAGFRKMSLIETSLAYLLRPLNDGDASSLVLSLTSATEFY